MKTNILKFLTAGILPVVLGVGVALADAPALTLTTIPALTFATFPQTYPVTGTVSHLQNNLNSVKDLAFTVNGEQVVLIAVPYTGNDIRTSTTFSFAWTIPGPGNYTLAVSARHGGFKGTASQTVTVALLVPVDDGPAAPAIAAAYLKSLGYKPNSATYTNIIAQVSAFMGPGTDFNGVKKSSTAEYEATVKAYVDTLLP